MYFLMAVPIGYAAFRFADWYWLDLRYYPAVIVAVSNTFS